MSWEQEVLNAWSKEYNVDSPKWMGYKKYPFPNKTWVRAWITYGNPHKIYVDPWFELHSLLAKAELWHEFCHHAVYKKYGKSGHCKYWKKFRRKKVLLWVLDILT